MSKSIWWLFVMAFTFSACREHIEADVILYNGNIYTVDSLFSKHEAIAIKDGKILEVGTTHDVRYNYRAAKNIDLVGAYVYPGLIDAHCHFFGYAQSLRTVNLFGTKSWEEVLEKVSAFQEEHQLDYIEGRGWDQNDWQQKAFPTNAQLNTLFPNIPVVLTRVDGHAVIANHAALMRDTIIASTAVEGGMMLKDGSGNLSGVLIDKAVELLRPPKLTYTEWKALLRQAEDSVVKYGLTTLDDAGLDMEQIKILQKLYEKDSLAIKLYAMVADEEASKAYFLNTGKIKTDRLNVQSVKFYADGALGSRGACLRYPYHDDAGNFGLLQSSVSYFKSAARQMANAGWQMNTHAIGDSANRLMLQIYGTIDSNGRERRWRIEHAQVLDSADFKLFAQYSVLPSVQPTHATSDMYWAKDRLGSQRVKDAYAYKKLLEQYGKIALGTDFPVEHISPIKTFYAAVARKDASGYPDAGFQMENALSREEALKGMTIWAAFANFEETEKGSIEKGKWADLTIMDKDWLNCPDSLLLETKILRTYINGEELYIQPSTKKIVPRH